MAFSTSSSRRSSYLRLGRPSDDALLALLVHMASSDGKLAEEELEMITSLLPGRSIQAMREWITAVSQHPLDLHAISQALDTDDRRWTALRYCARMATRDHEVDPRERSMLHQVARALGLPASAPAQVLRERAQRDQPLYPTQDLLDLLSALEWKAPQIVAGTILSEDLLELVPSEFTAVARIGVDRIEVMGLYEEGFVARFLEGPAFLRWRDIISCSHGKGLAATLKIHTEDGQTRHLLDGRLAGLRRLLQQLPLAPEANPYDAGPS